MALAMVVSCTDNVRELEFLKFGHACSTKSGHDRFWQEYTDSLATVLATVIAVAPIDPSHEICKLHIARSH